MITTLFITASITIIGNSTCCCYRTKSAGRGVGGVHFVIVTHLFAILLKPSLLDQKGNTFACQQAVEGTGEAMCTYIYIYIYAYIRIYICVSLYTHAYIHTYIHTERQTDIQT